MNKAVRFTGRKQNGGTSLMVQWLRICLAMQGIRVQSLVGEDPTYFRATKIVHPCVWARVPQPESLCAVTEVPHAATKTWHSQRKKYLKKKNIEWWLPGTEKIRKWGIRVQCVQSFYLGWWKILGNSHDPYIWTFKLGTFKGVNLCSHVQSYVSSCIWHTLSYAYILYKWLCFCVFHYTVLCRLQYLYFKPRMSGSKHKSSGNIAGTTVLFKVVYYKIKNALFWFFLCIICVKNIINLFQYSII